MRRSNRGGASCHVEYINAIPFLDCNERGQIVQDNWKACWLLNGPTHSSSSPGTFRIDQSPDLSPRMDR